MTTDRAGEVLAPGRRAAIASPWSPGLTANVVAADWLGAAEDLFPVSREQAMKVPAVVAAPPGIVTLADLPPVTGRFAG